MATDLFNKKDMVGIKALLSKMLPIAQIMTVVQVSLAITRL
jgi:hypothetical protein